jgi:hypothetical protein
MALEGLTSASTSLALQVSTFLAGFLHTLSKPWHEVLSMQHSQPFAQHWFPGTPSSFADLQEIDDWQTGTE